MPKLTKVMLSIKNMVVQECLNSKYIQPFRLAYTQDGKQRAWDVMKTHDSVCILLHHVERESLLFVRQFRPPVFYNKARQSEEIPAVGTQLKGNPSLGLTFELCAGIVDKDMSLSQIASEEIQEEVGYNVPASDIEKITTCRSSIGLTASLSTYYYAKVSERQRISSGGGIADEGEYIDTVEIPISQAKDFLLNDDLVKPPGCAFVVMWFLTEKYQPGLTERLRRNGRDIALASTVLTLFTMAAGYLGFQIFTRSR